MKRYKHLIHEDWMMDVSHILLNEVEENSYFTDTFFAKYTYPFEFKMTDYKQFQYHYNQSGYKKVYDHLILDRNGKREECKLIILSIVGIKVSVQLVVGFENFPNFDKKLAELPLHQLSLSGQTLYDHAASLVNKPYPESDYTFPAVHSDNVVTDTKLLADFRGTYNLWENGKFVKNTVGSNFHNYNLLEPAVAFLYVLKTGFADAGYELKGNILDDEVMKQTYLFKGNTYSGKGYPSPVEWLELRMNFTEKVGIRTYYKLEQEIAYYGKFRISGSMDLDQANPSSFDFIYNGKVLSHIEGSGQHYSFSFEFINNPATGSNLTLEGVLNTYDMDRNLMSCTITPLELYNEDGSVFQAVLNDPVVELRNNVPDCTFGDLISAFKKTANYDLEREDKIIYMNLIESKVKDQSDVVDLSLYEVREPEVKFNEEVSFLLKYQNENEEFPMDSLYVDKSGASVSGARQENTQEITSPVIPLPLILRNNLTSAKVIGNDTTDIQILLYAGLQNNKNESLPIDPYKWENLHLKYWKEWLEFRINSDTFLYQFNALSGLVEGLHAKQKVYAYNRIHLIKKIGKQELSPASMQIDLELNSE